MCVCNKECTHRQQYTNERRRSSRRLLSPFPLPYDMPLAYYITQNPVNHCIAQLYKVRYTHSPRNRHGIMMMNTSGVHRKSQNLPGIFYSYSKSNHTQITRTQTQELISNVNNSSEIQQDNQLFNIRFVRNSYAALHANSSIRRNTVTSSGRKRIKLNTWES